MEIFFSETAEKDLDAADQQLRELFFKHVEKIKSMPPRRHMRFGIPFNVEDVTKQARLIYRLDGEKLYVLRCFSNHKEYERWYKSFR